MSDGKNFPLSDTLVNPWIFPTVVNKEHVADLLRAFPGLGWISHAVQQNMDDMGYQPSGVFCVGFVGGLFAGGVASSF